MGKLKRTTLEVWGFFSSVILEEPKLRDRRSSWIPGFSEGVILHRLQLFLWPWPAGPDSPVQEIIVCFASP